MVGPLPVNARICVAGWRGLVGSAVVRRLEGAGHGRIQRLGREEADLRDPVATRAWFAANQPEYVFVAAATVGGIQANIDRPVDFLQDNVLIAVNVLAAARETGVRRLLFLGSACLYPKDADQPVREEALLTGALEPTNEPYALAKIAGIKLCAAYRRQHGCDFISAMPCNIYGPGDDFDPRTAHVLGALIRRLHEAAREGASKVTVWGSGKVRREFLHADDLADALVCVMERHDGDLAINLGAGEDLTIASLAGKIRDIVAPGVEVDFDATRPEGVFRKCLDVSRIRRLGWKPRIGLEEGIRSTWKWFRDHTGAG